LLKTYGTCVKEKRAACYIQAAGGLEGWRAGGQGMRPLRVIAGRLVLQGWSWRVDDGRQERPTSRAGGLQL
jgi:hypothetical protein